MRFSFIFILLIAASVSVNAQTNTKKQSKKNYYVNVDSSFLEKPADRGSWMKGYYENDSLTRIECWYGFNFGDLHRDFYYWNNSLIMVIETQRLYNNTIANPYNGDSVKPNYEGRYLFQNDSITAVKQTGHFSFMDTPADKITMQNSFVRMSSAYIEKLDILRKKKKNRIKMQK